MLLHEKCLDQEKLNKGKQVEVTCDAAFYPKKRCSEKHYAL